MNREELRALSNDELFALALAEYADPQFEDNDSDNWVGGAIGELRVRGGTEIFRRATMLCSAEDAAAREVGLDVLGQLDCKKPDDERPHRSESVNVAAGLLDDPVPIVVRSAAWALSHLHTDTAIDLLIKLKNHPDAEVRKAVAVGLGGQESTLALRTLIELMTDATASVRDWSTFSLGTICDSDKPEIRSALRDRLTDEDDDVRAEALWGLVKRKEIDALRVILERLSSDEWVTGDWQAVQDALGSFTGGDTEELRAGIRGLIETTETDSVA